MGPSARSVDLPSKSLEVQESVLEKEGGATSFQKSDHRDLVWWDGVDHRDGVLVDRSHAPGERS